LPTATSNAPKIGQKRARRDSTSDEDEDDPVKKKVREDSADAPTTPLPPASTASDSAAAADESQAGVKDAKEIDPASMKEVTKGVQEVELEDQEAPVLPESTPPVTLAAHEDVSPESVPLPETGEDELESAPVTGDGSVELGSTEPNLPTPSPSPSPEKVVEPAAKGSNTQLDEIKHAIDDPIVSDDLSEEDNVQSNSKPPVEVSQSTSSATAETPKSDC